MQRTEKAELVSGLHEKMSKAAVCIVAGYKGIDAETTVALRKQLRGGKVDYCVVKNTLATLAAKGTQAEKIVSHLTGSNAVIMGYADPVSPAKLLQQLLKDIKELDGKLTVKGAVVDGTRLTRRASRRFRRCRAFWSFVECWPECWPRPRANLFVSSMRQAASLRRLLPLERNSSRSSSRRPLDVLSPGLSLF